MNLLARFKIKIYVLRNGEYKRVVGPAKLIDSILGWGGHIVIGDEIEIKSGMFFSGSNELTDNSIGDHYIDDMELTDITDDDKKELGIE